MLSEIQVCQENAELGLLMPIPPDEDQTHIESKFCDQDPSHPPLKQKLKRRDINSSQVETFYSLQLTFSLCHSFFF